MNKLFFILFIAFVASVVAQNTFTKMLYFDGGYGGCSTCEGGDAQFACSNGVGNWNDGNKTFYVNGFSGYVISGVEVTLRGTYNCLSVSGGSMMNVTLDGITVDTQSVSGKSQCKCGTCDGDLVFSNYFFVAGWPTTRATHGNHYVQVTSANDAPLCLYSMNVTLIFSKPSRMSANLFLSANTSNSLPSNCPTLYACGMKNVVNPFVSGGSRYYTKFYFNDPVGNAGLVIAFNVRVYGQYYDSSSQYLHASAAGTAIDKISLSRDKLGTGCNLCKGAVNVFTPSPYMFGWPNYKINGVNEIEISLSYGYPYISHVDLEIIYVPRN